MKKIYLIRHGKPDFASEGRYCIGITDLPLSEAGKEQAQKLKEYLQYKNIEHYYSSPLLRCRQTAELIAPKKEAVFSVNGFREIDMGDWEGLPFEKIKRLYPEDYEKRGQDMVHYSPPGGECFEQCAARAWKDFVEIAEKIKGNIAIIAHAGINRALLCRMAGRSLSEIMTIEQPYGCVNIIEVMEGLPIYYNIEKIACLP